MLNISFVWLIIIPLLASPLIYLTGRLVIHRRLAGGWRLLPARLALFALLVDGAAFAITTREYAAKGALMALIGDIAVRFDGLSLLLTAVALGLGFVAVLFSGPYLRGEVGEEKYYAMLIAMIGVMTGLGCAEDLFNLWVWFEAMAVSSYLLVVFYREQPASLEAGVKYVIQSASGSVLVLIGIALTLMYTGSLKLHGPTFSSSPALLAAGAMFIVGFGVKAALVPMHTWLPDAHTQAPSAISAMLSGVVIEAGLIAMLRALGPLSGSVYTPAVWGGVLIGLGALNMLTGNLMALRQKQVKRLLAYSSLSHVGYMVFGIGVALYAGQSAGAQGGMFHLLNHGLMKGLAFLAAGALLYAISHAASTHADHGPLTVTDLDGAARRYPLAALAFSLAVLGLGGLPPLAGFMSKWQIFVAGFQTQNLLIGILVIFAALNSVLSLAYYAPLVNAVYKKKTSLPVQDGTAIPLSMNLPLALLSAAVVLLGLWPSLAQWLTSPAGNALLAGFGR